MKVKGSSLPLTQFKESNESGADLTLSHDPFTTFTQAIGYLRDVGKAQLVCSEFAKRPKGRRKYLAGNDLKAAPQKILLSRRAKLGASCRVKVPVGRKVSNGFL
jgi:hypothetical protein